MDRVYTSATVIALCQELCLVNSKSSINREGKEEEGREEEPWHMKEYSGKK